MKITLDTFVISDTHFGQDSVVKRENIRQKIAETEGYKNHFKFMVDKWNSLISNDDKILHLGDVYFKDGLEYVTKLNGNKRLIIGNNDVHKYQHLVSLGWQTKNKVILKIEQKDKVKTKIARKYGNNIAESEFLNGLIIDIESHRVLFSHFPVFDRKPNDRFAKIRDVLDDYYRFSDCSLNIHGHTHSREVKYPFCINVSVEQTRLAPVRLREILRRF